MTTVLKPVAAHRQGRQPAANQADDVVRVSSWIARSRPDDRHPDLRAPLACTSVVREQGAAADASDASAGFSGAPPAALQVSTILGTRTALQKRSATALSNRDRGRDWRRHRHRDPPQA
jgi:hypothetical protein